MNGPVKRHFVCGGPDFDRFWSEYLEEDRRILLVFGLGFDPRSLDCMKRITERNKRSTISYKAVVCDYIFGKRMSELLHRNKNALRQMGLADVQETHIPTDDENAMSTAACRVPGGDLDYSDIVVDVTSMPAGVYFPMIRSILHAIKANRLQTRLYVTVSEDSQLDSKISETSASEYSSPVYKFGASMERQSLIYAPRIWIPVLGHNQRRQLEKIQSKLAPENTVPVLPMPSSDPYIARDLMTEYSTIFDSLQIEPRDIAYSDERHPSETCSKILAIADGYYELYEADGCVVVLSPLASKLLCVGCLMAACELQDRGRKIGVEYVPGRPNLAEDHAPKSTPFVVRLGESYGR